MPEAVGAERRPTGGGAPARHSVLVVDDQADVRDLLCEILGGEFDVVAARDGRAAIETMIHGGLAPKVAVVDILMPEKDGIETLLEMKRINPDIKVIAISGGGRTVRLDFLVIAKELGADTILRKPFEPAAIRSAVRALAA